MASYTENFLVHDHNIPNRPVEVHATREEIGTFAANGYLVRERMFSPAETGRLKSALDSLALEEVDEAGVNREPVFGGLYLRHLMDKRPEFLELFEYPPTLSVARAMLGPQVQVLPMTARIAYPDELNQETHWHFHQRVLPEPMPPFFCQPHVIDCLIYLDELNDENGALLVVPGSHRLIHTDMPAGSRNGDLEGQVKLTLPAGSCVMIHGNLWHRALPTTPQGTVRRLLILPYAAAWLKLPSYGQRPANGLMKALEAGADDIRRELLGIPDTLY